jgi:hypothetical protein
MNVVGSAVSKGGERRRELQRKEKAHIVNPKEKSEWFVKERESNDRPGWE